MDSGWTTVLKEENKKCDEVEVEEMKEEGSGRFWIWFGKEEDFCWDWFIGEVSICESAILAEDWDGEA